jgi:hypothetical protein
MQMSEPGVYMIFNVVTNARYVGSTPRPLSRRWSEHKCGLRKGRHGCPPLQAAWNLDGEPMFHFIVLETNCADLFAREQYWIDLFRGQGWPLYNRCPKADSHKGLAMPEGFSGQCRKRRLGSHYTMSPEGRANIRAANSRPRPDVSVMRSLGWILMSPTGEILHVHNLLAFAREKGIDCSALRKVALGKLRSYKGYHPVPHDDR